MVKHRIVKKAWFVLLMFVCGSGLQVIHAQDVKKNIQEHYAAVKQMIASYPEDEEYPVHERYQVIVTQNLPGTGRHEETVQLYYGERDDDEIYPSHYLEYVSVAYNFAAAQYCQEYLFDKNGNITFIYAFTPEVAEGREHELRFYFNRGKLFDVLVKSRKMGVKQFTTEFSGQSLPEEYSSAYELYFGDVAKYRHLFDAIDAATHR